MSWSVNNFLPAFLLLTLSFHTGTNNMVVFVVLLVVATALRVTAIRCGWFSLTLPYRGRFCIGEGTVIRNLLPRQCRHVCLQSATCKAYNYNVTEGTCTRFTSPCPQAYSDPIMEFVVFRETPTNKCYEWVSYSRGDPLDERMIATDSPWCIVARLQVNGNDVVSYMIPKKRSVLVLLKGQSTTASCTSVNVCV